MINAIFTFNEVDDVIKHATAPVETNPNSWDSIQKHTKAYLHLYVKPDMYSLIAPETDYLSFKHKWDKLCVEMDKGDVPTWKFTFQLGDMQGATY